MQLIGMLDSPYVRRVAIALHHFSLPFEHQPLSVFRNIDEFSQINPVIKAPTLICDDGEVLMDSTLILEYVERLTDKSLMPEPMADYQRSLRLIGLGLTACDKTVQIEYERKRPADKQYQPWQSRLQSQVVAAYDLLEPYASSGGWVGDRLTQADITICVAWQFTQHLIADVVKGDRYPALSALSKRAEALPAFQTTPLEPNWQPKF